MASNGDISTVEFEGNCRGRDESVMFSRSSCGMRMLVSENQAFSHLAVLILWKWNAPTTKWRGKVL
jgi:hypothetical protein